jgi:CheY-like chemotaxis protein
MDIYRILVVDDQRDVRRMLRSALETLGPQVKVTDVPSGEEAILIISKQPVDLLISDVWLPGISGLELKDRARMRNPEMRMILITGVEDRKVRQKVIDAGVDAYFFKPIEMGPFLATVQGYIGGLSVEPEAEPVSAAPLLPDRPESAHTGRPIEPEVEPPAEPNLASRLAGLRAALKADSILLFDGVGTIIAQAGELPAELGGEATLSMLGEMMQDATRLSLLMGVNLPRGLLYFPGSGHDLYLTHVGQNVGLLLAIDSQARDEGRLSDIMGKARLAARDLLEMLVDWGVPVAETSDTPPAPPAEESVLVVDDALDEVLPELDAIFAQAKTGAVKSSDADAFWNSITGDDSAQTNRSDALSYDQARQLGLAPDGN